MTNPSMDTIRKLLTDLKKVAVVGLSPEPDRPSHGIADFLIDQGYDVVGVRPLQKEILGRPCYSSLKDVPGSLEIVDVFRNREHIPKLVDEILALAPEKRPKMLWLQDGVYDDDAEDLARKAGITVVSDRCIYRDHRMLSVPKKK